MNTQDVDKDTLESLRRHYTISTHHFKGIILLNCNECVKDAYYLRLYQCLKAEQTNHYDMYINIRFDNILTAPIQLDHYTDKLCVITGNWERDCFFHNRDWDLMSVGDHFNYKIYHYPIINNYLSKYYPNLEPLGKIMLIDDKITEEEINKLNKLCGLVTTTPNKEYSCIIRNMIRLNGSFVVSEKVDKVHVNLLR